MHKHDFYVSSCGIMFPMHTPSLKLPLESITKINKNNLFIVCIWICIHLWCIICLNIFIFSYLHPHHIYIIFSIYRHEDSTALKDLLHVIIYKTPAILTESCLFRQRKLLKKKVSNPPLRFTKDCFFYELTEVGKSF